MAHLLERRAAEIDHSRGRAGDRRHGSRGADRRNAQFHRSRRSRSRRMGQPRERGRVGNPRRPMVGGDVRRGDGLSVVTCFQPPGWWAAGRPRPEERATVRQPDVASAPLHSNAGVETAPGSAQLLLSVMDLRVHFATRRGVVHAVDGVTLDIHEGETLGLVGETGSGKSVTAKSLLRLVPTPPGVYAGGEVSFRPRNSGETVDLLRIPEQQLRDIRGNRIAMIFQDPAKALNPALSVRQQLAEVFAEHRSSELFRDAELYTSDA